MYFENTLNVINPLIIYVYLPEVTCPVLNLTHATWSDERHNFGDAVTFTCDEGYQYNNKTTGILKCQGNSQWNGDTTGCRRMSVRKYT